MDGATPIAPLSSALVKSFPRTSSGSKCTILKAKPIGGVSVQYKMVLIDIRQTGKSPHLRYSDPFLGPNLTMRTTTLLSAQLPDGKKIAYLDSGPVPGSVDYVTVVLIHGTRYNACA